MIQLPRFAAGMTALFLLFALPHQARAWGERGHHIIGSMAAKLAAKYLPDSEKGRAAAKFFSDRAIALGHLANVPDTSWKDPDTHYRISKMNSANHYFGPERVLGAPPALEGAEFEAFLERVKALPADYDVFKARYEGTENRLPGVPADRKSLDVYSGLGTTPWRSQQLYTELVRALACARTKEEVRKIPFPGLLAYHRLPLPLREPADGNGDSAEVPLPTYVCSPSYSRESDLAVAVIIAGVLGHFVGDQSQPYHPTADHDGWTTGNGGLHVYFESLVVQEVDERLQYDVLQMARDDAYSSGLLESVWTDVDAEDGTTKLLFNMAADSQSHKIDVLRADDEFAVLKKGQRLEWGDHPWHHEKGSLKYPERREPTDSRVLSGMRPVIVERLAAGTVTLGRLWAQAWHAAGKPDLTDMNAVSLPYPLDPPFIWPDFDRDALERTNREGSTNQAAHACVH